MWWDTSFAASVDLAAGRVKYLEHSNCGVQQEPCNVDERASDSDWTCSVACASQAGRNKLDVEGTVAGRRTGRSGWSTKWIAEAVLVAATTGGRVQG